jgi:RimJ/RimL family protein N-acetyltransferase
MWTDPQVTRFMGGPREAAQLEQGFMEDANSPDPPTYDLWPVIEKATGDLIGYCGLLDKKIEGHEEIELIYVFVPAAWGRGYATEIGQALREHAVKNLGLTRLVALIEPENEPSVRVAERLGFQRDRQINRPAGERLLYVFQA